MRKGVNIMLGERLIHLRKEKKLTQQQIADKLHLSRGTYAQYEINRRVPEYGTLEKMADFFEVSIDYLVGRTKNPKQVLSEPSRVIVDNLDLSDEEIMEKVKFSVDGIELTPDLIKDFLAYVRTVRAKDK